VVAYQTGNYVVYVEGTIRF